MADPTIIVATDAPLVALGMAATLRRAASDRRLASTMSKLRGRIAMRSDKDAQATTVRFNRGRVEVVGGVDADAHVIVTTDFDTAGLPGAPKPKITGAVRHPIFALRAGKVLEPKVAGGWRGAVEDFVKRAEGRPGLPEPLLVVCTDDGSAFRVGGDGPPAAEIHGSAEVLTAVFTSAVDPAQAWLAGHIRMLCDPRALQRFSGLTQNLMMGA